MSNEEFSNSEIEVVSRSVDALSTKVEVVNFYSDDDINISPFLYSTMAGIEYVGLPTLGRARTSSEARGLKARIGGLWLAVRKRSKSTAVDAQSRTKSIGEARVGSHVIGDLGRLLR